MRAQSIIRGLCSTGILLANLPLASSVLSDDSATLKEAYEGRFKIGVAINRTIAMDEAVRADNVRRSKEQVKKDTALTIEQFNQVSPENDLKWALIHPQEGPEGYDWDPADAFVEFGIRNKMYIVGHTLVWHGQTPFWVFSGDNPPPAEENPPENERQRRFRRFRFNGPRASRAELLDRMKDHIHTVVGRYKGKIHAWDVVNEAIADGGEDVLRNSLWKQIIGDDYIAKAFEYAHEADPDAILRYNDYGLENPAKRAKLIKLIKSLQDQNVPVKAIGTQAHLNVSSASFENMDETLTELETLGLPIHVTELDINSARRGQGNTNAEISSNAAATQGGLVSDAEQRLATAYTDVFRAFKKHQEHLEVVTFWGVNDAVSWRGNGKPLLFDGEDQPKPAFEAVISVAEEE